VKRLLDRMSREWGGGLLAVWLYGSRARGEADPDEALLRIKFTAAEIFAGV
jgi:predicted nucleotidyltransferase